MLWKAQAKAYVYETNLFSFIKFSSIECAESISLFVCGFTPHSRIFHLFGDVSIRERYLCLSSKERPITSGII